MPTINGLNLYALLSAPTGALQHRRGVVASCRWGNNATNPYILGSGICTNVRAGITYSPASSSNRADPIGEMLQMAAN